MKQMLANRHDKKLNKKIPVDSGKKSSYESELDFHERIVDRMEKQDNSFNETMKGLQQTKQIFTHTMSNAFQMMSQMFAPVHSYSQPVDNTQNYHVFPNYPMTEALNTHPAISPQYPHPLFPRYNEAHSSTGDGVRGSNSSNENEKEINIDEENEKAFRQL